MRLEHRSLDAHDCLRLPGRMQCLSERHILPFRDNQSTTDCRRGSHITQRFELQHYARACLAVVKFFAYMQLLHQVIVRRLVISFPSLNLLSVMSSSSS